MNSASPVEVIESVTTVILPYSFSRIAVISAIRRFRSSASAPLLFGSTAPARSTSVSKIMPSCAFEGMDKTYSYPGFDVTTYTKGGSDYVSGVIFWDDSVATAEGVYIGQTLEDIRKAYGADVSGETSVSLTRGASKLLFLLKDGAVSSIQYLAVEN